MTLLIRTARVSYRGPDRLDVTRKSATPDGIAFAPSWAILRPAIDARKAAEVLRFDLKDELADATMTSAWNVYVEAYRAEMLVSYRQNRAAWDALLARERVVLCCYCSDRTRCHTVLLAGYLEKLGARYEGEVS